MSVKASVSLTAAQAGFARGLVAAGRYPCLSAVLQHGLELRRAETEAREAELAALRALLEDRAGGSFVGLGQGRAATEATIAARRRAHGL
jgi:antitoxin ParD1/3/4